MRRLSDIFSHINCYLTGCLAFLCVFTPLTQAQIEELYLFSEDMTPRPLELDKTFYQKYVLEHAGDLRMLEEQINWWNQLDAKMDQAGFRDNGLFDYYQNPDRQRYIQSHLSRFVTRRARGSIRDSVDNWRMRNDLQEEMAIQKEISKSDQKDRKDKDEQGLFEGFQFKFKQRLVRGFVTAEYSNPWISFSGQLSANGTAELYFNKNVEKVGLDIFASYRVNDGRYLASLSKKIYGDLYLQAIAEANNGLILVEETGLTFTSRKMVAFQYQKSF